MEGKKYTDAGTDINEVKRLNAASGLTYNEMKDLMSKRSKAQSLEEIAVEPLEVDSNTYRRNEVPGSVHPNRNDSR